MSVVLCCEGVIHLSGYVMPEDELPAPSDVIDNSDDEEPCEEDLESDDDDTPDTRIKLCVFCALHHDY